MPSSVRLLHTVRSHLTNRFTNPMRYPPLRTALVSLLSFALVGLPALSATPAHAAVSNWLRGSSVLPKSTTDYASANFQQSMRDLKATGATTVGLTIPYYQSNIYSTDI